MPRRVQNGAPPAAPRAAQPPAGADAPAGAQPGGAARPPAGRTDNFAAGAAAGAQAATPAAAVDGPFAALAARGEYRGLVPLASGQEVYVSIKLGKNPAANRPVVFLDGVAGYYDRNSNFEQLVKNKDQTIISIILPGQGDTLANALNKGQRPLASDIEQENQARAVVETLDALGIKAPVGVSGISYGGAIAAQAERMFPDRFNKVLLIAPYVESQGKRSSMYSVLNNPWNPWGQQMYRTAARNMLAQSFPGVPDVLKPHGSAFHDSLFRLSMGLEDFELDDTVRNMSDVHFLVVPQDSASPPEGNQTAFKRASTGSFTVAPNTEAGHHYLIAYNADLVATWMSDVMAGRKKAEAVN